MTTLFDLVRHHAEQTPDALAILASDQRQLTYAQLTEVIQNIVSQLNRLGIGRNDPVAVVLPNGPEMAVSFLSVASGATCAPLNPGYQAKEYEFYLTDLDAKGLITLAGESTIAETVAAELGIPSLKLNPFTADVANSFQLHGNVQGEAEAAGMAQSDDVALVLHTSGTTSRPKIVPLRHANIIASAGNIRNTLALTPTDRCMNVMPLFHIHGLMAALTSSISAGASIVCTSGFMAPRFYDWLVAYQPTWYTAVPTMHQAILGRAEQNRAKLENISLRFLRSSSSSLPPQVMNGLESVFNAPLIEAYGMTEASHQMTSNQLPPGARKPGSVGPQAGPDVAIMSETDSRLLAQGETGEIVIRGPNVTYGYASNPDANAKAFVDGWFRTGDQGHFDEDGYLFISGRLKEIINRGGEKIAPREVDEVLLAHPAVKQALTFAIPDERLGEDVAAALVLLPDVETSDQALRRFVSERLAAFKVPKMIVTMDEIPKGATGKLQRIGLAAKLGITAESIKASTATNGSAEPESETEKSLTTIWKEVLELSEISVSDQFLDIGGDSILATKLAMQIRRQMRIKFDMVEFFEASTIRDQARFIDRVLDA